MTIDGTLDLIKNIIDIEMEMPQGRVWAYNGDQNLPQDNNLFIVLSYMSRTPYSNTSRYESDENGLKENQSISMTEDILISVVSRSVEARERCYEIAMALRSQYSQQIQSKFHFHLSYIGDCVDASFLEASARLNRFDIRCTVFRGYTKSKYVDFYDKFPNTAKFEPEWHIN